MIGHVMLANLRIVLKKCESGATKSAKQELEHCSQSLVICDGGLRLAGLSSAAVTRNFPALPNDLDMTFLNEAKVTIQHSINKEYKDDVKAKIAEVKKFLLKFEDGTIDKELKSKEFLWAAKLILFELNRNKAIKEV